MGAGTGLTQTQDAPMAGSALAIAVRGFEAAAKTLCGHGPDGLPYQCWLTATEPVRLWCAGCWAVQREDTVGMAASCDLCGRGRPDSELMIFSTVAELLMVGGGGGQDGDVLRAVAYAETCTRDVLAAFPQMQLQLATGDGGGAVER